MKQPDRSWPKIKPSRCNHDSRKRNNHKPTKGFIMKAKKLKRARRREITKFEESVNIVPCTRRIQRQMWCNMRDAAASNVNLHRQARAQELLAAAQAESKPAAPAQTTKPATVTARANAAVQVNNVVRSPARQVLPSAINSFKNGIKAVRSFAKRKILFWRGSQWQVIQKEA